MNIIVHGKPITPDQVGLCHYCCSVADPGFANGGGQGASIEAPKAPRGVGRGFPLTTGEGSGDGARPLPRKFFDFRSKNVDF